MKGLSSDLTDQQRIQKMNELYQGFNNNFSQATGNVFTDPQQQARYNQLYLQYQGFNAFNNPTVQQKLNLTPEQMKTLGQYGQDWQKQMTDLGRMYQSDPTGSATKFNEMRQQSATRLNSVLTPDQQKAWQEMTGQTYNFPQNIYFQTNPTTQPNTPSK